MALNSGIYAARKLAGKTIFITGASRGIGKSIALKCARDGANVAIAAKTATPHPKLPGTIFTAAEEIEAAGGKCLPCMVDIRSEEQVRKAVEETVRKFGGIDILVNNASAISLTGTLETPMKKYDLMMGVNARGTYLCSQACLPYLKVGNNPHILNISPPLNMDPKWFKNHNAYTLAKYGMSVCVLGMSEEFKKDGVAVNALWPQTAIMTAAMEMLGGGSEIAASCRKPEIMADAAYAMLCKDSRSYTGNFAIDEDVLRDVGMNDMEQYACVPGHELMPDFFLDAANPDEQVKKTKDMERRAEAAVVSATSSSAEGAQDKPEVIQIMDAVKGLMSEKYVKSVGGIFVFKIKDGGIWHVDMKNGTGSVGQGEHPEANATLTMNSANFVKMFNGSLSSTTAFMTGRLRIDGDMMMAMKLEKIIKNLNKSKL